MTKRHDMMAERRVTGRGGTRKRWAAWTRREAETLEDSRAGGMWEKEKIQDELGDGGRNRSGETGKQRG